MKPTSLSLIDRIIEVGDSESWERLTAVYEPLLRQWLKKYGVQNADADDLIQEVLAVLTKELPQFQHSRRLGAFRSWLRRILVNRLRNHWRSRKYQPKARGSTSLLEQLDCLESDDTDASQLWNVEHDRKVLSQLVEIIRPQFQPKTWEAFRQQMFDGRRADAVAADLNMSIGSVYVARSRVLAALRREADGLVDSIG